MAGGRRDDQTRGKKKKARERGRGGRTHVILDVSEATVTGDEGGDLLGVLDELDTDALADSRVGLLGLNTELLEDDTLGVGSASEGVGLPDCAEVGLLVLLVGPTLVTAKVLQLARGADSSWLTAGVRNARQHGAGARRDRGETGREGRMDSPNTHG